MTHSINGVIFQQIWNDDILDALCSCVDLNFSSFFASWTAFHVDWAPNIDFLQINENNALKADDLILTLKIMPDYNVTPIGVI